MMGIGSATPDGRWKRFEHPVAFWSRSRRLHRRCLAYSDVLQRARHALPDDWHADGRRDGHRNGADRGRPDSSDLRIAAGESAVNRGKSQPCIRVRALDDAPIRPQHVAMLLVVSVAVVIDVMKPATLSFVTPGMVKEYGLKAATNPHGSVPVALLPFSGIVGTVIGSWAWGWAGRSRRLAFLDPHRRDAVRDDLNLRCDAVLQLEPHHVLLHGHRRGRNAAHHVRPARRDHTRPAPELAHGADRRRGRGSRIGLTSWLAARSRRTSAGGFCG